MKTEGFILEKVSIFLTVGSQLPFDRLIKYGEKLEEDFPDKYSIFYQTCSKYKITSKDKYIDFLTAEQFDKKIKKSDIIVTHAGIGSIINSFLHSKYIVVVPREFQYGEHRNDHQLDTARKLNKVPVARNFDEFLKVIECFDFKSSSINVFNDEFYKKLEEAVIKCIR